ncbi:hypothetical protein [Streptomyces sp. NPDC005017]|uniref:hypothetical protein n=1 Tax=Streptomyces sp. NPDC005017 TaxID=3364706 RepID=UPI00368A7E17
MSGRRALASLARARCRDALGDQHRVEGVVVVNGPGQLPHFNRHGQTAMVARVLPTPD